MVFTKEAHVQAVLELREKEQNHVFIVFFSDILSKKRDKVFYSELTTLNMRPENAPNIGSVHVVQAVAFIQKTSKELDFIFSHKYLAVTTIVSI